MENADRVKGVHDCQFCKFFTATEAGYGMCRKRPGLYQKHDDRVYKTGWCQYWETGMTKKEQQIMSDEAVNTAVEDRGDPFNEAEIRLAEARTFQTSIANFDDQLQQQAVMAVMSGDNTAVAEVRGMIKATQVVAQSIEARIQWLDNQFLAH